MRISDWISDVCSSDLETQITSDHHDFIGLCRGHGPSVHRDRRWRSEPDRRRDRRGRRHACSDRLWHLLHPCFLSFGASLEIGRASFRERVCKYVYFSGDALSLKKKKKTYYRQN